MAVGKWIRGIFVTFCFGQPAAGTSMNRRSKPSHSATRRQLRRGRRHRQQVKLRVAQRRKLGHADALCLFLVSAAALELFNAEHVVLGVAEDFAQCPAAVQGRAHGRVEHRAAGVAVDGSHAADKTHAAQFIQPPEDAIVGRLAACRKTIAARSMDLANAG